MADESAPTKPGIAYWIDLAKWAIVSVGLVVMTTIIDAGFKDRAAGIVEMGAYDKYVTDLVVLNEEVGPRRLLAQYFAHVTASDKLRPGWQAYYALLDSEYKAIAARDSAQWTEQKQLLSKPLLNKTDSIRLEYYETERRRNENQLYAPLKVVEVAAKPADAASAAFWEQQGFDALAKKDAKAAIEAFRKTEESYNGYHNAYELTRYLQQNEALHTNDTAAWNKAAKHIVVNYAWGMPKGTREKLLKDQGS